MPAPAGNRHNPHGRPRRVDVQISHLEDRAQRAREILEGDMIAQLLGGIDPALERHIAEGVQLLAEIEARLGPLRHLAEEVDDAAAEARRRRRTSLEFMEGALGRRVTPEEVALIRNTTRGVRLHDMPAAATTAAALDRTCSEEAVQ